jgi:hypothetical protein
MKNKSNEKDMEGTKSPHLAQGTVLKPTISL